MTHEELRDRLLDLAYGELSPRQAREVEEHAAGCEACGAELGRIRGTRRLMAALPEEPAPERGASILVAAAREAARAPEPRRRWPRWAWAAPVAAASLAAVVAVSLRIGAVRPASLREDPNALMGEPSPPRAPEAPPAPVDAGAGAAARDAAGAADREARAETSARAEKKAAPARARDEGEARFATPPPPERAPERNVAAERLAAAPAPAAPPVAAAPAPAPAAPRQAASEPAAPSAPQAGVASALPAPSADRGAPAGAAKSAAAPARQMQAKAMAAPEAGPAAEAGSPDEGGAAAVARYEELRRSGRLRAEVRVFPACPREPWRRLERDPEGRIVSYAWENLAGSRRLRLEAIYAPDGSLAARRAFDAESGAPETLVKFRVPRSSEVDLDAPTPCDR
jgi:hypothetical protein